MEDLSGAVAVSKTVSVSGNTPNEISKMALDEQENEAFNIFNGFIRSFEKKYIENTFNSAR